MPTLTTGKTIEVFFDKVLETYNHQTSMLPLVSYSEPDAAMLQNAGDVIWKPKQQHRPIIEGDDLSGQETEIIEEEYPCILGTLKNDYIQQTLKNMRDKTFWERAGEMSGKQQHTELNQQIANAIRTQGSLFYRASDTSGLDFISRGQEIQNKRQAYDSQRYFMLNDTSSRIFSNDLGSRQTVQGRPEDAWNKGQIAGNVAQYDVYTGSFLPNLTGGADAGVTADGDQRFEPEAGSTVNAATGTVTNSDYRSATITTAAGATAGFSAGDKVTIGSIESLGLANKESTGDLMTFTIVSVNSNTSITVYPKPIAADDVLLTVAQAACANVDTTISDGDAITRINTGASEKTNLFWDKSAIEVMGGALPANLFQEYDGMKVVTETMDNGLTMYLIYDGNIEDLTFRYRLFTWYGITVGNPSNCGVAISY